ncbi:ATP-binding protein [Streptomyces sp. NBC_01288]|uniref:ATP-binding protein n=1 Tax=Streptomyces sp. NBC_01288 TaxID=2903814 RepID=UPI002E152F3A|nr:ATP-binding protein [Streptomyces sp. NBC_01288]
MDERLPEPPSEWRYILRVPHDPLAPAIARDTVRSVLTGHALPELADTAVLLTSELLTNAWRHAPGPASLSLKWADKRLRASVWDAGFLLSYPTGCPEPYAEGGRGLALVELCADAWGSFVMGPAQGKVVWFELLPDARGRVAA